MRASSAVETKLRTRCNTHAKCVPPAVFVPFFSCSSSVFPSAPARTSKRQPSGDAGSITGSTQAFFPSLVESRKDDTNGTIAPLARGSGERTVRAHSQAMTVDLLPSGSRAFG